VFVNSDFENHGVDIALPKQWQKRVKSVKSYRTDARHDLAYSALPTTMAYEVAARGVTTLVIDLQ
jgi:hypothetical protein